MKPGDKVVYTGNSPAEYYMNVPIPLTEVCTIMDESVFFKGSFILKEYPLAKDGGEQSFHSKRLIKIDDWKQAEYMVEELKEELDVTV